MLDQNLVLKGNELFIVGDISTEHTVERATGLYARDTRHLSRFRATINGAALQQLSVRTESATNATIICSNPLLHLVNGDVITPQRIMVEQRVAIGDDLKARFTVQSYSGVRLPLTFALEIAADFRDLFDIRGYSRKVRGDLLRPCVAAKEITLAYRGLDGHTAETTIRFDVPANIVPMRTELPTTEEPVLRMESISYLVSELSTIDLPEVLATFPIELDAGERWVLNVLITVTPAGGPPLSTRPTNRHKEASVVTDFEPLNHALKRCLVDLDALQTTFPHGDVPAAGIPWFVAPFGRDSLTTGLQTLHLMPERAAETLRVLGALQGKTVDRERDEEPGKILHEMRYGEMARLGEIPHTPYFGTLDATPLFVWLFGETVAWMGDRSLFNELLPHAERAIAWIEQYGDLDGDGLVEYRIDSDGGGRIVNQVWKDSYDSLNHTDGRPLIGPIAPVEVQGYVYAAYSRLSDVVEFFGDRRRANELRVRAEHVRGVVEDTFWMPELNYYAQALDGEKRQVQSLSSNPGHLLAAGLPTAERANRLVDRMAERDLSSGWGIRTLAEGSYAYNPMSYHNGSIWPHDNSVIAGGFYRYGRRDAGAEIGRALVDATVADRLHRLPELYCGFSRVGYEDELPVGYPVSCSPQAWAAGALPLIVRCMLGLAVDLESRCLLVNPALPDWISRVSMSDLQVLGHRGSLTVERAPDGYVVTGEGLPLPVNDARSEALL